MIDTFAYLCLRVLVNQQLRDTRICSSLWTSPSSKPFYSWTLLLQTQLGTPKNWTKKKCRFAEKSHLSTRFPNWLKFGLLTTILPLFSDIVVHWHSFHSSSTQQFPPDRLDTSVCSVSPTWLLVSQVGETWSVRIEGLNPISATATQLRVATVCSIVTTMTFLSHHGFAAEV